MNIKIPDFLQDEEVEGVKIFLACLYLLADGDFKGYRYFIDSRDVRAMMQRFVIDPTTLFSKYQEWIQVGVCSDTHWFIDWQVEPNMISYEIERQELIHVWCYLIGRIGGQNNIVEDWNKKGFPPRIKEWVTNDNRIFYAGGRPKPGDEKERDRRREFRRQKEAMKPKKRNGRPPGSKNKR